MTSLIDQGDFFHQDTLTVHARSAFPCRAIFSTRSSGEIKVLNGTLELKLLKDAASGRVHIPRSVQLAVQQRLDHLSPDARHLRDLAAVAGRRFDFELKTRVRSNEAFALLFLGLCLGPRGEYERALASAETGQKVGEKLLLLSQKWQENFWTAYASWIILTARISCTPSQASKR